MFDQAALQELLSFRAENGNVVSLYLNADVGQQPIDTIKRQARGLLRELQNGDGADANALEKYLEHAFDWSKPGLALFSCAGADFFRAYPAAVPFRNRIRVSRKPYVKPLAHLLDVYAHYGVIVVDQVGGRFFEFHLGELQDTGGALGEEIRKVKRGRGSSATGMRGGAGGGRQEQEQIERNLRETATEAGRFFSGKGIRRLFVGGTQETAARFQEMLPRQLQSILAATFAIDKYAPEHEIRDVTLDLLRRANERRELELVDSLITAAAGDAGAVVGLDATLKAVAEGRVQSLIVSDGFRAPGFREPGTSFVVANLALSPLPAESLLEVPDIVEEAVALTMEYGGQVEVISDNPQLEKAGRIGAILRF